jgi:pimeloyl-ACP methyl ester carboxylesterase
VNTTELLLGIVQYTVQTERLRVAYLTAGNGATSVVLVHGNVSSSLFFQSFMLALAATDEYTIYAPDMRGYGDSETLPVDATRGVRDFSDDLASFVRKLGLTTFHLFGWSLGGNIAVQYAIDYPGTLRTLTLEAASSPFGFGGTKDIQGTLNWDDAAGSGGGTASPDFVQRLAAGDRGNDQFSPRTVMNTFYFKPPFRVPSEIEEIYVSAMLSTKTGEANYPGDIATSPNWPFVAPGKHGVNNAIAPIYLHQTDFATARTKPPVLWIHGADDQIVSDQSLFDLGVLGQLGVVPNWPGASVYPAQPMKAQLRALLDSYQANGGMYREVVFPDCGHTPHVEKQDEVVRLFIEWMSTHNTGV